MMDLNYKALRFVYSFLMSVYPIFLGYYISTGDLDKILASIVTMVSMVFIYYKVLLYKNNNIQRETAQLSSECEVKDISILIILLHSVLLIFGTQINDIYTFILISLYASFLQYSLRIQHLNIFLFAFGYRITYTDGIYIIHKDKLKRSVYVNNLIRINDNTFLAVED